MPKARKFNQETIPEVVGVHCFEAERHPHISSDRDKLCVVRKVEQDSDSVTIEYVDSEVEVDIVRVEGDHTTFQSQEADADFSVSFPDKKGEDCEVFTTRGEREIHCNVDWS